MEQTRPAAARLADARPAAARLIDAGPDEAQPAGAHPAQARQSEASTHAWNIFGSSPIPSLVVNVITGMIVDANSAGARLLGRSRRALRDRPLSEFVVRGAQNLLAAEPSSCSQSCHIGDAGRREAVLIDIPHAPKYRAIMFLGDPSGHLAEDLDALTGLATRDGLPAAVTAAVGGSPTTAAIAFIDVDEFKRVNDEHGHLEGDAVLLATARAIKQICRDTDTAIRFGGDEFVVVLPRVTTTEQARQLGDRIRTEIEAETDAVGHRVTASVGVALFDDADQFTGLHTADVAMYTAKRAGGNQTVVFP